MLRAIIGSELAWAIERGLGERGRVINPAIRVQRRLVAQGRLIGKRPDVGFIPSYICGATSSPTSRPTEKITTGALQTQSPIYEIESVWGNNPAFEVSFTSPNGIAIDVSDNVYVTEFRGNRVQKLSPDGVLLTVWGSQGSERGEFQSPTGIAIDGGGNVYVSEIGPPCSKIHCGWPMVGIMGLTRICRRRVWAGYGYRRRC
jgi:hypothetical protein